MTARLVELAGPWLERTLGFTLPDAVGRVAAPVVRSPEPQGTHPLLGVRIDATGVFSVRPEWLVPVGELATRLHPDMLFSVFGSYELSRITLPAGVSVWGPVPNYFADSATWRPIATNSAVKLTASQLEAVDWKTFWHCGRSEHGFGIHEGRRLTALATVADHGERIMEIGVDVAPDVRGRGLGRAVVSAAGNWILGQGGLVHATAAAWNVPSGRTLRSLGMEYAFGVMRGSSGPFQVPPQPLGKPLPDAETYDRYPRWDMNSEIRPKLE